METWTFGHGILPYLEEKKETVRVSLWTPFYLFLEIALSGKM